MSIPKTNYSMPPALLSNGNEVNNTKASEGAPENVSALLSRLSTLISQYEKGEVSDALHGMGILLKSLENLNYGPIDADGDSFLKYLKNVLDDYKHIHEEIQADESNTQEEIQADESNINSLIERTNVNFIRKMDSLDKMPFNIVAAVTVLILQQVVAIGETMLMLNQKADAIGEIVSSLSLTTVFMGQLTSDLGSVATQEEINQTFNNDFAAIADKSKNIFALSIADNVPVDLSEAALKRFEESAKDSFRNNFKNEGKSFGSAGSKQYFKLQDGREKQIQDKYNAHLTTFIDNLKKASSGESVPGFSAHYTKAELEAKFKAEVIDKTLASPVNYRFQDSLECWYKDSENPLCPYPDELPLSDFIKVDFDNLCKGLAYTATPSGGCTINSDQPNNHLSMSTAYIKIPDGLEKVLSPEQFMVVKDTATGKNVTIIRFDDIHLIFDAHISKIYGTCGESFTKQLSSINDQLLNSKKDGMAQFTNLVNSTSERLKSKQNTLLQQISALKTVIDQLIAGLKKCIDENSTK